MNWIRSSRGDLRYLAWGGYKQLAPMLQYLTGPRRHLERILLASGVSTSRSNRDIPTTGGVMVDTLIDVLGPRSSAFLLYTGHYKPTWFVGPVSTEDGTQGFVKLFKHATHARADVERATILEQVPGYGTAFRTVSAELLGEHIVRYEPAERARTATTADSINIGKAIAASTDEARTDMQLAETWLSRAQAAELIAANHMPELPALDLSSAMEGSTLVMSHGDLTPWNIVPSSARPPTLIDYERVGKYPRFYDLVYAATHEQAFRRITSRLDDVARFLEGQWGRNSIQRTICAALAASVVVGLEDLQQHPDNARLLNAALRQKVSYMKDLL